MHPVNYLFEEIYRAWGLPQPERRNEKHRDAQVRRRRWPQGRRKG